MNTIYQSCRWIGDRLTLLALDVLLLMMVMSCSTLVQNHAAVALPNASILGRVIDREERVLSLARSGAGDRRIYPVEVRLVVDGNKVTEIQALYAKEVDIATVATAVNLDPNNHEIEDLHSALFRMWGNKEKHYQIQLREYGGEQIVQEYGPIVHEGEKLLIITRTLSKAMKN
jgi:hypothetical protein